MIEKLCGRVTAVNQKQILLQIAGSIEIKIFANSKSFIVGQNAEILTYLHWSPENGPSIFGFSSEQEKEAFKILIECPKVGPSLGINILNQIEPTSLFSMIEQEDEKRLARINGIGPKCAKNMISFIKNAAVKYLANFGIQSCNESKYNFWLDIKEALINLGYANVEVQNIVNEIKKNESLTTFDQALRAALSIISKKNL